MSHDRGCWKCGREPYEYGDCKREGCVKKSLTTTIITCANCKKPLRRHGENAADGECQCPNISLAPETAVEVTPTPDSAEIIERQRVALREINKIARANTGHAGDAFDKISKACRKGFGA